MRWMCAIMTLAAGLMLAGCKQECPDCVCDCADDDDDDNGDDDTVAECSEDTECEDWEICEDLQCVDGDRNNDFDEATLVADGSEVDGWINPPGDVDYYRLLGESGWFFKAYALDDAEDYAELDTVIRFYDASGSELGYNDDFERLSNIYGTDAVYMGCTPDDGTWYLTVEDYGSFINDPSQYQGGAEYNYVLEVAAFAESEVETEPNDDVATAFPAGIDEPNISYDRAGVIDDDGDVDLWKLELEAGTWVRIYGYENTATEMEPHVRFLGVDGEGQIAAFDEPDWSEAAAVPILDADAIYVELTDDGGDGGDDYCYVLHMAADGVGELFHAETEPNDTEFDSEQLQTNDSDVLAVAGRIDPMGDLDHYLFQADAGDEVVVTVQARTLGSSLGATVRLVAPNDFEVAAVDVDAAEGAVLDGVELPQAGTYHLEITATDPMAGGVDQWYRVDVEVD
jgi:hypothetical protein